MPDNDTAFEFEKARCITKNKLWNLLNPNDPKEPTKADITFIADRVKDGFLTYMKDSRDINYLRDNTVVTVQDSLTDKCKEKDSPYKQSQQNYRNPNLSKTLLKRQLL